MVNCSDHLTRCSNLSVILFLGPIVVPMASSTLSNGTSDVIVYFLRMAANNAFTVCRANLQRNKCQRNKSSMLNSNLCPMQFLGPALNGV